VGDALFDVLVIVATVVLALSATSAVSILVNLRLIRWMGVTDRPFGKTILRLGIASLFSLFCDIFFIVLLVILVVFGRPVGLYLEENFNARISDGSLRYGFNIGHRTGEGATSQEVGVGLWVTGINFDELKRDVPRNVVVDWALPWGFDGDAGSLCDRYDIRPTCRDRLRSLFFRNQPDRDTYVLAFSRSLILAGWTACGRDLWSTLPQVGKGAAVAIKLIIPFFAAIGALYLTRALMIPTIIATSLLNFAVVKLARYSARGSEIGYARVALHAAALLGTPPILAVFILWFLTKALLCS
jgi:hypothetical protein